MSPDPAAIRAIAEQAEEMRAEPPRPLTRQMPPADAFPVDALGDVLGAAARAIHDRLQAPLAICSQSVLTGNDRGQPKTVVELHREERQCQGLCAQAGEGRLRNSR